MDTKGIFHELAFPVLVLALVFLLVLVATASAAVVTFPVAEGNCGTLGNVLATVQHMRNEGGSLEDTKKMLKQSSEECVATNGKDNCILQDDAGKKMLDEMVDMIWKLPPTDAYQFGLDAYNQCKAQKGKST